MKSLKTKINPNNKQVTRFQQHAGVSRHAYNWGLDVCKEMIYKEGKTPSAIDLHKLLNKDVKSIYEWYYDSSKCAPQEAIRNLQDSFTRFWKQHKINKALPMNKRYLKRFLRQYNNGELKSLKIEHEKGFPRYKKRGIHDGFYLDGAIYIDGNRIKVPRIGWIKTYEELPVGVTPKNVTISRQADDWFVAFTVNENPDIVKHKNASSVGVDLGIKTLAMLSDGKTFESPKAYKKAKPALRRLQKKLCRQKEVRKKSALKGVSKNYIKTKKKLAVQHQKVANIRMDATHKLTSYLTKNHSRIVIEDLNVSGMVKNHNLASSILDGGFYEFKRQLEYKCKWNSVELVVADRWFASSKTCSCCGHKQDMPLKKRIYTCGNCGMVMDRDLNAAINLNNYTPSYGGKACGDAKFHAEGQVGVGEAGIRHRAAVG